MKRFFLATLTTLALYVIATPEVRAEPTAYNPAPTTSGETTAQLSPFELVTTANQGQLSQQGIPSFSQLTAEFQLGRISAKDLVQAAIQANRLPAQTANDASYLSAVQAQLQLVNNIH
jgi:hypothetical protein